MNNLEDKIRDWINKNGYPFEMEVARIFQESGFQTSQSILYKDRISEKYRETDLIAFMTKCINDVWVNLTFVVECKKTTDKPWIIFKNKKMYSLEGWKYPHFASKNAKKLINEILASDNFQHSSIFPKTVESGYNIAVAFNEKSDMAYQATQSIISTCEFLVNSSNNSDKKFLNIYIPIVAIEGKLYEAFLQTTNDLAINNINHTIMVTTKSFEEHNSNIINIISSDNLEEYISRLYEECEEFYLKYSKEIDTITERYPVNNFI